MLTRRQAVLRATPELLVELCKRKGEPRSVAVTLDALPDDTRFIRAGQDATGDLLLVVESESFQPVPINERLPELPLPVFEVVWPERALQRTGEEPV